MSEASPRSWACVASAEAPSAMAAPAIPAAVRRNRSRRSMGGTPVHAAPRWATASHPVVFARDHVGDASGLVQQQSPGPAIAVLVVLFMRVEFVERWRVAL